MAKPFTRPLTRALQLPIHAYRLLLSPWVGMHCRFLPTCSAYALEALETHGPIRGGLLAIRRISSCHPFGREGFDPVPPAREKGEKKEHP